MTPQVPSVAEVMADASKLDALPLEALLALRQQAGHLVVDLDDAIARRTREVALSEPNRNLAVLTTGHLARMWQMPEPKIRELCRTGALPARKLGPKEWVISADGLRDWLPKTPISNEVSLRLSLSHGASSEAAPDLRVRVPSE